MVDGSRVGFIRGFFAMTSLAVYSATKKHRPHTHSLLHIKFPYVSQLRKFPQASRSPQAPRHAEIWANDVSMIELDC